jgi:hypothetical protein
MDGADKRWVENKYSELISIIGHANYNTQFNGRIPQIYDQV